MKTLVIVISLVVFGTTQACKTPEETVKEQPVADVGVRSEENADRFMGIVKVDGSCGVVIHVIQGDVMRYYSPTNLDNKFAREGMKIEFTSVPTGKKLAGECSIYEVTEVSDVSEVR